MTKSMGALLRTEMRLYMRDFFGVFFAFVFPVLMLFLFGSLFGTAPVPGTDLHSIDLSVPAYAVMITGVTGLMCLPLTMAGYKENGIYKRFDASPVGRGAVITSQVLVNLLMTVIGIGILLIAAAIFFDFQIRGSWLGIAFCLLLATAAMFSIGILCTAAGNSLKTTNLLCCMLYFVMIFLSGATLPASLFPEPMKDFSRFLPMTHAVNLVQAGFTGTPLADEWVAIVVLCAVTGGCLGLACLLVRRRRLA